VIAFGRQGGGEYRRASGGRLRGVGDGRAGLGWVKDLLDYPGFHQIFFYGDDKRDLSAFAQLYGIERVLV